MRSQLFTDAFLSKKSIVTVNEPVVFPGCYDETLSSDQIYYRKPCHLLLRNLRHLWRLTKMNKRKQMETGNVQADCLSNRSKDSYLSTNIYLLIMKVASVMLGCYTQEYLNECRHPVVARCTVKLRECVWETIPVFIFDIVNSYLSRYDFNPYPICERV